MRACGWMMFVAAMLWWGTAVSGAADREYWILAAPGTFQVSGHPPAVRIVPKTTQPYAYGWFGPQPRRHAAIHYGYRQNFIQWSLQ